VRRWIASANVPRDGLILIRNSSVFPLAASPVFVAGEVLAEPDGGCEIGK